MNLRLIPLCAGLLCGVAMAEPDPDPVETPAYIQLHEDVLINADLWTDKPEILAANYGFEGIIGVPDLLTVDDLPNAVAAGAGVNLDWAALDPVPPFRNLTSAAGMLGVLTVGYGNIVPFADAMPIEVSWPLLPSTVSPDNIQITLNDGRRVFPVAAALNPNYDYNERHVIVVFGKFGNRLQPGDAGAVYPDIVTFVEGSAPMMAVGPDGPVPVTGLSATSSHPYVAGPALVGAKLTRYSSAGDFPPPALDNAFPNDAYSLYGQEAQYRLRLYTSGGFSPDGVSGIMPTDFDTLFRLHAVNAGGDKVIVDKTGQWYDLGVGRLKVVGLAEVGAPMEGTPDRAYYVEDHDNYFDVVLTGDAAAMVQLQEVEIPTSSLPGYSDIYNPGGPGRTPQPGVTYTKAALPQLFPIDQSLDAPRSVSYAAQQLADYRADSDVPVVLRLENTDGGEVLTGNTGVAATLVSLGARLLDVPFANEAERPGVNMVKLYTSPQGKRLYTLDANEQARLVAAGWTDQGPVFGAFDHAEPGLSPIYRFYDKASGNYRFSHQPQAGLGWSSQGVAWYAASFLASPSSSTSSGSSGGAVVFWPALLLLWCVRRRFVRKPVQWAA